MSEIERLATAVGLSAQQREMLAALLAEEGIELDGEPPITPLHGHGNLPLSFSQQSLWFLQQMEPESPFYNIAVAVRLTGELDLLVLGRALAEVTRRHETLRSTFVEDGGEPRVRVAPPGPVPMPLADLSGLPAAAARRLAGELTLAAARRGFDLAVGPLLRVLLLKLDRREHTVVLTLHHAIADGWSLGVLVQEVGALYGAFLRGGRSPLPELPFQYTDFAGWQQKRMQGAVLEKELAHWRDKLAGAEPVLELPIDHPRPAVRSDRGSTRIFVLPTALTQDVERLGRREGVSLFMTLLAAFFALLERYTGQRDLVIGYPVANRDRSDIEGMIGLFLNTLVLRVDLAGDPAARALLGRVRDEVLDAQSHAQLPFEVLVKELRPERNLGYNPLFQVMFVLQNTPASELRIPGLAIEATLLDLAIAQFDLTCRVEKSGDTLLGRLEYSEDLFESATIERLCGHFERLLAGLVADPQRPLSQLPLLTRGERHQLLAEWNDTAAEWRPCAVHRLIEEQVRRTPEATALVWGEEVWSYGQLNAWANRLARHLLACGLRRGEPVGIALRRSPWVAASVLGVMKAGGCYVPLDPAYPPDRLAYMLGNAGASRAVSEEGLAGAGWLSGRRQVQVDTDREAIERQEAGDLELEIDPLDAVYVIYTSGSTGRPKGVELSHRSLASFLVTMLERPGLGPQDVVAGVTALPFDPSGLELFLPLMVGARLVVASEEETRDGRRLLRLLKANGVTLLQATPVTWGMLLEAGWSGEPRLRALCGGEALGEHLARELAGRSPEVWNIYGPTETTVWSVVGRVREGERITVGRMVARMTSYVLSDALEVAPVGVAGELWIGGIGLARGYAGQPALTAERFLPSPFGGPGERLYRTGDLVRRLPDGRLEHLGRSDHQVKVRGHRIELGEIESALAAHPGVAKAVVTARDAGGGDRRLVAYVVMAAAEPAPGWDELRSHLAARLPDYMVPAVFVALAELPLTPSRKVDRRALPAPEAAGPRRESLAAPGSQEELLAGIFAEVLKLEQVGVDDNFFALGGHSLQAAQVAARVYAAFRIEMSLRTLFEHPTVAALAARIGASQTPSGMAAPPVEEPLPAGPPLSFAQQRLWFLDQLEPGSAVYNIPVAVELKGRLDVAVMAAAFAEVVRRHEVLRTTFMAVDGEPVQAAAPPSRHAAPGLPVIDLRALPGRQRKQEVSRLRAAEAQRPFDLGQGPLLRTSLLRLGTLHYTILVTVHHIVSDGWSMSLLVREIVALYPAFLAGAPSPLPELAMQYAGFAAWQRRHLSGEYLASELAWWRSQLAGMPPALELPVDHPRPAVRSGRGGQHVFTLKTASLAGLKAFSGQHGATLFMTLLAGFLALLQRYTGEDDLAVGTPVAGRTRVETEPLIGLFVNTLVLRAELAGDPEVLPLLDRVRETTLSAYSHQEVPFERLVEELAPERDLSRSPLVQVLFVVQNVPSGPLALPGLELEATALPTATTKLDLTFTLAEMERGLEGTLEYSRDLFDPATVERLADHFTRLLTAAVAAPQQRLSQLPLLSEPERCQLLDWNQAQPEAGPEMTLTALWAAAVRRAPEAPAVSFEDDTLSYGELDRHANRLAWRLRRLGVGPESRVGVLLDRSLEQVVALLGILKAGGAYVPFDPSAPEERLELLCADSGIQALVTDDREETPRVADVVRLDRIEDELDEELEPDDRDLPDLAGADNLCYVIYTSGSTGRPKGVLVRHGSVARLLSATGRWFNFGPADVWTLFHSYSFDFSVWELWGALAYGGRLVMVPHWVSRSPEAFWWLLAEERVTVLNQTPSAFRQLVQADGEVAAAQRARLALRLVIFGGEALDLASLRPWYERHAADAPRLVNMYGITETTVHVSYRPLHPADLAESHRSPIGEAIPDLGLRVLSPHLELVPVGVTGEICVGGAGLARGYLGRPELTAERFVPDPFSPVPGERLYRSGDLARYRPDGDLDYLGRRDNQVKVRGFRIELGEIEAALLAQAGVRSAAVLPRQDSSGSTSLVAYVETAEASAGGLRESLRGRLPEYMVPAAFVLLKSMPLTVNGKLDRKALAALPLATAESADAGVKPRTRTEELVAGIFAEVLSLERVGPEADFFALGGHSLLATQVASRLRTAFGVELAVRAVFETPTVEALASRIDGLTGGGLELPGGAPEKEAGTHPPERPVEPPSAPAAAPFEAIPLVPRDSPLELSFAQQRLWFLDQLEPGSPVYNIPVRVELNGRLEVAVLAGALAEVVRRHEVLRTTFQFRMAADKPVQVVAAPAAPRLPVIDLSLLPAGEREAEAGRLTVAEAQRPFDLGCGPLLRAALLRLGSERHVALLTLHHIVSDGWSMGVLVQELGTLYAALLAGVPSPLPELAVQYADFAAWQRRHLSGELLASELAWWHEHLAGLPPVLELPADHPRTATSGRQGAEQHLTVDAGGLAGLATLSRRYGVTLFMTLLAGFAAVLQRYTGEDELAVGTPLAGRTRVEIEPLIGLFVNTLVLRLDLSGDPAIATCLERVREMTLAVFGHQELPFERLVEDLAPERDLSRQPLVQVFFVVQNAPLGALELPGLALRISAPPTATTKFDLSLTLREKEQGLVGNLEYRRDLFEAATMARLAGHFTRLLAALATNTATPGQPLSALPLLSPGERHQVLGEWNDTAAAYPCGVCLHELIAAQAARTPEAVAAVFEGEALTYGELLGRSRRLARHLRGLGVETDGRVGVLLERSLEMIVALLGVLEAGAAYVPLDPTLPAERLAAIKESAGLGVILTREGLAALPAELSGELPQDVTEQSLAYVLFTSGSTGTPKGVMIPHQGIVNRLLWMQEAYGLTPGDRVLQKTPFGFDVSLWEFFWPLLTGARLVFARPEGHKDPQYLVELIAREGITTLHFVPSMLEAFLEAAGLESLSSLRRVMASGEALPAGLVRRFFARLPPGTELHNLYGPTEASVDVSFWPCVAEPPRSIVPIGRPIANHRLHVVDRWVGAQPIGVPGELLLGGPGLARGYLGRPELTAAAFVPDPFGFEPGGRLYRTGDLVRQLADGNVEFLGRLDHQVKVRGFRIELGEIEAALLRQSGVREAVVLVRGDGPGDKRLVAYVVGAPPADLRESLRRALPEYMVPSDFVLLESLPLTANGKADRRALSRLAPAAVREAAAYAAPQGPVEERLAAIWAEVLGPERVERVGAHDDFFALGGHSLLATQVISRLRRVFGVEMPVRALFEAPTVAALAARIDRRLGQEGRRLETPPVVPVPRDGALPLSFAQARLWFLDQLEPASAVYNIPVAVELAGRLEVAVLGGALAAVVGRHEALRTTFRAAAGKPPVQVIADRSTVDLPVIDLGSLPAEQSGREADRLTRAEARRPFDLVAGPLLRTALLRLGDERHRVLLTMHHIISDGWSIGLLVQELGRLYAAFQAGAPSPLPELAVQYADFAAWQRRRLSGELLASELAWWRGQLAGMPPALELPTDHPRLPAPDRQGAVLDFTLGGAACLAGLAALSRQHGVTLFMTLLAGFSGLLQRLVGADDLAVGTPLAGRTRVETEPLIGLFVNTLVLRLDLAGDPAIATLLDRVRETTLSAYAHQEVPFERLVEELVPERDLSRPPLVQVMFVLQNAPSAPLELPGLALEASTVPTATARLELTCALAETEQGLVGALEYRRDLFEAATMARLAGHFTRLLAALAANTATPGQPLSALPLLSPGERHQVLGEWNDTAAAYPRGVCLHELIAAQAARTPEAVAAVFEGEALTYGELLGRSRRLARHLRGLGVETDGRVGVRLERSLEMIVALLGVLEAGAAYVPLDPTLPAERLAAVVESAGLTVILTRESLAALPAELSGELPQDVIEQSLAYVLFTSGSTGTPKGVMIPHQGIVNRLLWMQEAYGLTPADRVLQKTPFGFDVSLWEFFWPLLTGARLVFARPEGHKDPQYLVELIAREGITTLHFVPSMLEAFLEAAGVESLSSLRRVMASGEALPAGLVRRFFARLPKGVELHNLYGPTEASVDVSFWPCVAEPPRSIVPIGRPIANHRLHVVDRWVGAQPIGVPGELLLGGPGLARGYLGRPELTAAAFVPDPFGFEPGGRLYRTGDLVRQLADGNVEFLGRLDHQVKVRGFRIELGEIEAALLRQPGVREAVVLVRGDGPGDKRLVAYVVGAPPADLRETLRRALPEYMVPSDFVLLESLPLTANGKADRRALSRLAPAAVREAAAYAAPQGPVEEVLAAIWAEVLGPERVERVGAHDDFFALGGHSLLATQVISRLREAFGVEMPVRALFEAPTVAALAARIDRLGQEGRGLETPPLVPVPRDGAIPLSFAQQRLWFLDRMAPDNPFYNMFSAVRLSGALDVAALRRAFGEIVRRHEALRTTFRLAGERPCQAIAPAAAFLLPLIDLEALAAGPGERLGGELARLAGEESQRPFDLARGPLFRAHLVRHGSLEHTLLVNLHHIISDGWSMGILLREVAALYGAFAAGEPSPLPELPVQYADFAVWQRGWLQGERLEAEIDYWRRQLDGVPDVLELPLDHPRPPFESFRGGTEPFALPAALVRRLTALARQGGATLSMTMLAGFQALLGRYGGQDDIATGIAIANRTRREVEGLIGFFVNTLVVRSDLAGAPGFGRLLTQVRETALAAYAHQDLPFERLVEELQPERVLNRNPLIQVMVGYQNFPQTSMEVRGLVLSPPGDGQVATGTSKFDLALFLFEDGDRLHGVLEYSSELFAATTIRRLLVHYENLLAAAVAAPEASLALLPLLAAAEVQQLVREWNDAASAYPAAASLQELFTAHVRHAPDAPAVRFCGSSPGGGEGGLSYAGLNRRANRLAHRLLSLGAGPESRIGISLERSPEMTVGLLGILKAGGAYVPLDADYPPERLAYLVEDSGLRLVVADAPTAARLPAAVLERAELVVLGGTSGDDEHDGFPADDPPVTSAGGSIALVIYTSGSTGRPKGVALPHHGVARLVRETNYMRVGPGDRVGQTANISFDAATWEIWTALLNGAELVVIPREVSLSSPDLAAVLRQDRLTSLFLTTALFTKVSLEVPDAFRGLRELYFGGETVTPGAARAVLAAGPPQRLLHAYGPAESTTYATWHPILEVPPGAATIPIGRPVANTTLYVMDRRQSLLPQGSVGELCIGGEGLARGYWGRPELTAERFVPHPWEAGERLYRTGDLVRMRPDGSCEFLGRIDNQVKIRGFRIEPGEIESRLGEHPAVLQNAVLAREDVPGDRRLVAYVVQNPAYELQESGVETGQVSQWGELFDDIYRQDAADSDASFNIIGWNSTYTEQPLPRAEMEEWLAETIDRILGLAPRRVLEIGSGTGMILFKVAPHSELYVGSDVSAQALGYVGGQLDRLGIDRSRVELLQGSADQLPELAADSFDTVIVNSVAQYFPSADYLAAVVTRAVEVVRPGGAIFLGDLRSLPLLPAFHTSLELFQADDELAVARLRQKVQARRLQENELVIDPAFFAALRQRLPKIGRIEVYTKRGHAHNELTGYRYQVVLRLGEVATAPEIPWLDWQAEGLTVAALRRVLTESAPAVLGLRNVPNARVAADVAAVRLLREDNPQAEGIATAGELRLRAAAAAAGAVDPQDLWDLPAELPYRIELSLASPGAEGRFEAVLQRSGETWDIAALLPEPAVESPSLPLGHYTNDPLKGQFARRIAPELRRFLKESLPDFMVPAYFVLLDALPFSPSGKVDRRKLPAPDDVRTDSGQSLVAPRNSTEQKLLEIWRELLGIDRIGVDDDFFALGGHSLLATQAVSRVREAFGVELPLRTFFGAPSVAALAAEVDGLRLGEAAAAPAITPVPRDGLLPLSFAQERLWFLDRLEGGSHGYNESAAFRLEGPLDVTALRWSLDELLRRHESLRTAFPEVDGQAVQTILPAAPFEMPLVDLRGLPAAVRDAEALKRALERVHSPFDLARGPLVRGLLLRLGEGEHAVLFSFHHIVFDGWSTGIFVRELSALYSARISSAPSLLPPLAIQYADFAAWQRRWLQGEALEQQLAWWRRRLAGVAVLELPTDRPRAVLAQSTSGQRSVVIPPALTASLRALSRSRGTTLFMTVLAGFQALLQRYTGQDDVAVGSPIANRNRGEIEALIGFFVNMLVLRTDLAGDPSFGELLERVRQTAIGAYAHQDLPFEKLVEELRPGRDLRHTPLFQVSFQVLNVPSSALELPGLALQPFSFAARAAKFDFDLALTDEAAQLAGVLDYNADLFDAATMQRLAAHLDRLLAGAAASPGLRLSELPLLSPAESSQVVAEWNDTQADLPGSLRLHELFEAQVERTPAAVAVVFEGEELTYRELNARANRLAHGLRRRGVGAGARVGLCLERSPELVVGLLGVLKAGAAWVPLDPAYPADRLAFVMSDARVPVLLTQERLLPTISAVAAADSGLRILCLDGPALDAESAENPAVPGSADELAYVIYTSGSTGRPKGAMNSHRGIRNRLLWLQQVDALNRDDRVMQKTPYSFDVSVWEFFWPLLAGARLVVARPGGHQDPDYLVRLIREAGITTMHFVPSMLQVFVEAADVESCTSLRRVVCSGEALTAPLAHRFVSRFPAGAAPVVYNLYGPTEASVEVTAWRYAPESPLAAVPIGRPVANTTTHVLDPHLRPVPIGIPGELFLGGVQIARGYLDRPALTAEKFIPDPFAAAERAGARLYRTGDLVRRLAGGEIVYLGRLDHQVKVRGFRIELGEIEAALSSLAGIREAVVVAREETPGDQRLVAYLTGEAVEAGALRQQLRDRLPEFMVPAVFVHLEALPLNSSGKVDRKALPAPDPGPAPGFVAPRTPAEEVLAEIWQEVLRLPRVGVHDNFFELGGHSLLAVLLMARIERRFGRALPLATLFTAPTLEALAALLGSAAGPSGSHGRSPLVAVKPQGDRAPFFCVHPVGGNVLCYLDLARHLAPEQPFYALQTPDPEAGREEPSLEEMAARYLREVRRVQPAGPYRLGGWSMGGLVAFEMARQLARQGEELDLVALIDTPPPALAPRATPDELAAAFALDLARLEGNDGGAGISLEELGPQAQTLFAMFAANLQASRAYVPEPFSGGVTVLLSEQTQRARGPEILDGWRRSALGGVTASTLPGDHYSLLRQPQVERLAGELTALLATAAPRAVSEIS